MAVSRCLMPAIALVSDTPPARRPSLRSIRKTASRVNTLLVTQATRKRPTTTASTAAARPSGVFPDSSSTSVFTRRFCRCGRRSARTGRIRLAEDLHRLDSPTATSLERTSAKLATTAAAAIPASTQKASEKPLVSASGCEWPDASSVFTCVKATVEQIATPSAPPICCEVLISPDARPASCGSTPASAAIETGMNANAIPTPTIR